VLRAGEEDELAGTLRLRLYLKDVVGWAWTLPAWRSRLGTAPPRQEQYKVEAEYTLDVFPLPLPSVYNYRGQHIILLSLDNELTNSI
jgi:hypothetical protein